MRTHLPVFTLILALLAACGPDGAPHARRVIRERHATEVKSILVEDVTRHLRGVTAAAKRIVPGFAVEEPGARESQLRTALRLLTKPPKGIPELVARRTLTRAFAAAILDTIHHEAVRSHLDTVVAERMEELA